MALDEDKNALANLRHQLRALEKCFVEYRKSNGDAMSDFAWVIVKMETAIERMGRAIERIEKGRQ